MTTTYPPTGNCYEAAYEHFQTLQDAISECRFPEKQLILVHGSVVPPTGRGAGTRINHAWIEYGPNVLDVSNGNQIDCPRADYNCRFRAEAARKYTPEQALWANLHSRHYGPWE